MGKKQLNGFTLAEWAKGKTQSVSGGSWRWIIWWNFTTPSKTWRVQLFQECRFGVRHSNSAFSKQREWLLHEVAGVTWGGEDQSVWKPCWQDCTCEDQFKFFSQSLFSLLSIARWHTFFFFFLQYWLKVEVNLLLLLCLQYDKKNQWRLQILLFVGDLNSCRFLYCHT